jgi:hypothetical protein
MERVSTDIGEFIGTSTPLVPELGLRGPQLFRGVSEAVLADLRHGEATPENTRVIGELHSQDPRFSFGAAGTCLAVVGLDL